MAPARLASRVTLLCGTVIAGAATVAVAPGGAALAHPPTDFLKIPVGRVATVPLPPIAVPAGQVHVAIRSGTPAYRIVSASAGPGWRSRVTPDAAFLDGRATSALPVIITLTGRADRPGELPIRVRTTPPATTSHVHTFTLTALAGRSPAVARMSDAAPPNQAVLEPSAPTPARDWTMSAALAVLAAALLLVWRPRRRATSNATTNARSMNSDQ